MAKSKNHKHSPARVRRRTQPTQQLRSVPTGGDVDLDETGPLQQELVATIGEVLKKGTPLDLLETVSQIASVTDPRGRGPFASEQDAPTYELFLESMMEVRLTETSAVLAVLAAGSTDDLEATRIRRELTERHHRLPAWLRNLAFEPYRAAQMREVYGDGDNVLVGVRLPSGYEFTVIAYVEHNLGSIVKDAFTLPAPIGEPIAMFEEQIGDSTDQWFEELDLADARTRLEQAIERGAITYPPLESETWPGCRSLVEWVVRELPSGGRGYERPEWSERDVERLAEEFFGSAYGRPLDDADERSLVESLLWFGTDYGPCDPLHWSPIAVEILLADWLPRKIVADADYLAKAPEVLRAFIRFAHDRTGLGAEQTSETVAAVDRWEPDYQKAIRTPRRQGPEALLERMGGLEPLGDILGRSGGGDEDLTVESIVLESLVSEVGGEEGLDRLDAEPLPDEALDYDRLPDDIHERVAEVAGLVEEFCEAEADVEFRTACRRLLGDAAAGEPNIFRRRGAANTAAAAVCWMVAKANDLLAPWAMTAQELVAAFGVKGNVANRSHVFQKAIGVDPHRQYGTMDLGTPRYLTAERRAEIIERRDRYLA